MTRINELKYIIYTRCPKALWLSTYKPEVEDVDLSRLARRETTNLVRDLAKGLRGPYTDILTLREDGSLDIKRMVDKTMECILRGDDVLVNAAILTHDNLFCLIDILEKTENGYNIFKVKGATSHHLENNRPQVAYQRYVAVSACIPIDRTYMICINPKYTREEELDTSLLFKSVDVTESSLEAYMEVEENVRKAREVLESTVEPVMDPTRHCVIGVTLCPFWGYCSKNLPKPSIFNLSSMNFRTKIELYHQGIKTYGQLQDMELNEKQHAEVMSSVNNEPRIDHESIKEFVKQVSYPLYFLDFETVQSAVPLFQGTKPFGPIPFQYSLHYIEYEGGPLYHKEFLDLGDHDPRRTCAERLCEDIPMNVCTTAYNKTFECARLEELAALFPDLSDHLLNISEHIVDLQEPFFEGMYFVPKTGGTCGLKVVLPALYPDDPTLDYRNLEGDVHNGLDATSMYLLCRNMSAEKRERARQSLLRYCELDTYALVKIWEKLKVEL